MPVRIGHLIKGQLNTVQIGYGGYARQYAGHPMPVNALRTDTLVDTIRFDPEYAVMMRRSTNTEQTEWGEWELINVCQYIVTELDKVVLTTKDIELEYSALCLMK